MANKTKFRRLKFHLIFFTGMWMSHAIHRIAMSVSGQIPKSFLYSRPFTWLFFLGIGIGGKTMGYVLDKYPEYC